MWGTVLRRGRRGERSPRTGLTVNRDEAQRRAEYPTQGDREPARPRVSPASPGHPATQLASGEFSDGRTRGGIGSDDGEALAKRQRWCESGPAPSLEKGGGPTEDAPAQHAEGRRKTTKKGRLGLAARSLNKTQKRAKVDVPESRGVRSAEEAAKRKKNDSYLVDPASSHMLVSKIKPCMSKFTPSNG